MILIPFQVNINWLSKENTNPIITYFKVKPIYLREFRLVSNQIIPFTYLMGQGIIDAFKTLIFNDC